MNVFPKSYRFADVLSIINGRNQKKVEAADGQYPIYGSGGIMGWANDYICPENTVVIGRKGSINNPIYVDRKFWNVDTAFGLVPNRNLLLPRYLFYFCVCFDFEKLNTTVTIPSLTKTNLMQIKMSLPPLGEQEKIICRLDKLCHLIELKKEQLKQLDVLAKSRFIEMFGDPELNTKKFSEEKLENLFRIGSSKRILQSEQVLQGVPFLRISDLMQRIEGKQNTVTLFVSEAMFAQLQKDGLVPKSGDILITSRGTLGRCYVIQPEDRFYFQDGMISWLSERNSAITNTYLVYLFQMPRFRKQMAKILAGSTVAYLSIAMLKKIQVPLPPLALQNEFAAFIEQLDKSKFSVSQQQKTVDSYQRGIILQLAGGE